MMKKMMDMSKVRMQKQIAMGKGMPPKKVAPKPKAKKKSKY